MIAATMRVPEEFDFLTHCFWNGSLERAKNLDEWVSKIVPQAVV